MRELQRENKFLLMEMDELYFRNEELSAQLRNYQQTGRAELESGAVYMNQFAGLVG